MTGKVKTYKVVKPLVIAKKEDGSDLYLYLGAVLPEHIRGDELARFVDEGFVAESGEADAAIEATAESN